MYLAWICLEKQLFSHIFTSHASDAGQKEGEAAMQFKEIYQT
jgi:hypothetical protein